MLLFCSSGLNLLSRVHHCIYHAVPQFKHQSEKLPRCAKKRELKGLAIAISQLATFLVIRKIFTYLTTIMDHKLSVYWYCSRLFSSRIRWSSPGRQLGIYLMIMLPSIAQSHFRRFIECATWVKGTEISFSLRYWYYMMLGFWFSLDGIATEPNLFANVEPSSELRVISVVRGPNHSIFRVCSLIPVTPSFYLGDTGWPSHLLSLHLYRGDL